MRNCKCGKQVSENARVCPHCGNRFTHPTVIALAVLFVVAMTASIIGGSLNHSALSSPAPVTAVDPEAARLDALRASAKTKPSSKRALALHVSHPSWTISECITISERKIIIGMNEDQVRAAWGKPEKINTSSFSELKSEQWIYGDSYLYFDNGILRSTQQSKEP